MSDPAKTVTVEPAQTVVKVGRLEVNVDAVGRGTITVDGVPMPCMRLVIDVNPHGGQPTRAEATFLPHRVPPAMADTPTVVSRTPPPAGQ